MEPHVPQARLRSYQGIVPKSDNWRTFGASQEELALRAGIEENDTERDMAGAAA
jgi:phthalate 4,5-dioxygenase oxygenase subunit